jgi:xanthine dehydrogenase accessory factor
MIIAIVGSGGKTTLLHQLARQYRAEGKSVFVTTTTHMFIEEDTLLTDDAQLIIQALHEKSYAMAGIPVGNKISALSSETYDKVCAHADVVLVEADGSKHMPLKFPNATEPVIPEHTDQIIVVWGPHGLGKPAREVCHRLALVLDCLGIHGDTPITREHVAVLLEKGYLMPLRRRHPHADITVFPPL